MPTPHNAAEKGQIAKVVLMPGDPLRAKVVAERYLDDAVQFNAVRALYQYDLGYQVEIIENYSCLSPAISDYPTDYKLAASQLKTLLSGR